jgi:hypothetical protein
MKTNTTLVLHVLLDDLAVLLDDCKDSQQLVNPHLKDAYYA